MEIATSRKPDENAARERLLKKTAGVRHAIDAAATFVRRRRIHNPSVWLEREPDKPHAPLGWTATQRIELEVIDLATARSVVAEARKAAATVDRVAWVVDATNAARTNARVAAAADARLRAEAYAEGLGVEVGRVTSVSERYNAGTDLSLGDVDNDEPMEVADTEDAMQLHIAADVDVVFEVGAPRW